MKKTLVEEICDLIKQTGEEVCNSIKITSSESGECSCGGLCNCGIPVEDSRQILCKEEKELIEILRINYNAAILFYHKYREKWCFVDRNNNTIIATVEPYMITLGRGMIYYLDELLGIDNLMSV